MPIQKSQNKQKIIPHLWFDKEAREAAEFYVSAFGGDSKVIGSAVLHNTPGGDADVVSFALWGYEFMAISAGPIFKPNPSISFMLNFDPAQDKTAAELDALWAKLAEGGKVLMPLQEYPFSKRYGWVEDKFGVSWQLMLTDPAGEPRPPIIPMLLYVTDSGKVAEDAVKFYTSIFKDAKVGTLVHYPAKSDNNAEGAVMFSDFQLLGQWFAAMDGLTKQHAFAFTEGVSLIVHCEDQAEIDYYWSKLSAVPASEQCGWLKDKYGVSWQITPTEMDEVMLRGTPEQVDKLVQAFLPMKKIDLAALRAVMGK
jgi:predicted 3-demethylubiquinone-9 3-methyltransferase (glyoxalase superfamily)